MATFNTAFGSLPDPKTQLFGNRSRPSTGFTRSLRGTGQIEQTQQQGTMGGETFADMQQQGRARPAPSSMFRPSAAPQQPQMLGALSAQLSQPQAPAAPMAAPATAMAAPPMLASLQSALAPQAQAPVAQPAAPAAPTAPTDMGVAVNLPVASSQGPQTPKMDIATGNPPSVGIDPLTGKHTLPPVINKDTNTATYYNVEVPVENPPHYTSEQTPPANAPNGSTYADKNGNIWTKRAGIWGVGEKGAPKTGYQSLRPTDVLGGGGGGGGFAGVDYFMQQYGTPSNAKEMAALAANNGISVEELQQIIAQGGMKYSTQQQLADVSEWGEWMKANPNYANNPNFWSAYEFVPKSQGGPGVRLRRGGDTSVVTGEMLRERENARDAQLAAQRKAAEDQMALERSLTQDERDERDAIGENLRKAGQLENFAYNLRTKQWEPIPQRDQREDYWGGTGYTGGGATGRPPAGGTGGGYTGGTGGGYGAPSIGGGYGGIDLSQIGNVSGLRESAVPQLRSFYTPPTRQYDLPSMDYTAPTVGSLYTAPTATPIPTVADYTAPTVGSLYTAPTGQYAMPDLSALQQSLGQLQQYGGSQQALALREQLAQQLGVMAQGPSAIQGQSYEALRRAKSDELAAEYGAERSKLEEELARRGLSASTFGGGRYGDLAGQQARARASFEADLLKQQAEAEARDRQLYLSTMSGLAEMSGQQDLAQFQANTQARQAQADISIRAAQLQQEAAIQGRTLDLQAARDQASAEYQRGQLQQGYSEIELRTKQLQQEAAVQGRTLDLQAARDQAAAEYQRGQLQQGFVDIELRAKQLQQEAALRGRDMDLQQARDQANAENQLEQLRLGYTEVGSRERMQVQQQQFTAAESEKERYLRDQMQIRELTSQEKRDLADLAFRREQMTGDFALRRDELTERRRANLVGESLQERQFAESQRAAGVLEAIQRGNLTLNQGSRLMEIISGMYSGTIPVEAWETLLRGMGLNPSQWAGYKPAVKQQSNTDTTSTTNTNTNTNTQPDPTVTTGPAANAPPLYVLTPPSDLSQYQNGQRVVIGTTTYYVQNGRLVDAMGQLYISR